MSTAVVDTLDETTQVELPVSAQLKLAFRFHPGGVAVITAKSPLGHAALTATSVTSVSAEPPLLAFSVSALSSSAQKIRSADHVVVHLLDAEGLDVARLGATSGIDRFADTSLWREHAEGDPIFHDARAWLRCKIVERVDASGSTLYLAEVVETSMPHGDDQTEPADGLVYANRSWHRISEASRME